MSKNVVAFLCCKIILFLNMNDIGKIIFNRGLKILGPWANCSKAVFCGLTLVQSIIQGICYKKDIVLLSTGCSLSSLKRFLNDPHILITCNNNPDWATTMEEIICSDSSKHVKGVILFCFYADQKFSCKKVFQVTV